MNFKSLFFIILFGLSLFACEDEEGMIIYPQKYVFAGIESSESEFFEYDDGVFRQVFPTELLFQEMDSVAQLNYESLANPDDGDEIWVGYKEIELLSDTTVRILFQGEEIYEDFFSYEIMDERVSITLDSILGIPFDVTIEIQKPLDELKLLNCYEIKGLTVYDTDLDRRIGPQLQLNFCAANNKAAALDSLAASRLRSEYRYKDTVMFNLIFARYDLVE